MEPEVYIRLASLSRLPDAVAKNHATLPRGALWFLRRRFQLFIWYAMPGKIGKYLRRRYSLSIDHPTSGADPENTSYPVCLKEHQGLVGRCEHDFTLTDGDNMPLCFSIVACLEEQPPTAGRFSPGWVFGCHKDM